MSKFIVHAPDDDPASTGFPVEVSGHTKVDAALDAAKKKAESLKSRASVVLVTEEGTNNAWSVQYHPEPPVESGAVDEFGVPQYKFEPEFRIVYDGTEVETEYDEAGAVVKVGQHMVGPREILDLDADGKEVESK